jgi:hypothetical protein
MALSGALTLALALAASAGGERLLLCRPRIVGDPALARPEAFTEAATRLGKRVLDYGIACEDAAEGARAARRAGLPHAIASTAEGHAEGSRFTLVLADADGEKVRGRQVLNVAPGADAVRPLRAALRELERTLPPEPGPKPAHVAGWTVAGVGVAAVAAGAVFALQARAAASETREASDPGAQLRAHDDWQRKRKLSGVLLAGGGAAIAAGGVVRFAF